MKSAPAERMLGMACQPLEDSRALDVSGSFKMLKGHQCLWQPSDAQAHSRGLPTCAGWPWPTLWKGRWRWQTT